MSGIYTITNIVTGHIYVGQSVNAKRRLQRHKGLLSRKKHENSYLQNHYNKYGAENFTFILLEKCPVEKLDEREVYWIKKYNSLNRSHGYNLESGGNPQKTLSEETKAKKRGVNNPMYGRKWNRLQREKIIKANQGNSKILNEDDVTKIKNLLISGTSRKDVSDMYGLHISTVSKIVRLKNWYWVCPELNEQLYNLRESERAAKQEQALFLWRKGTGIVKISKKVKMTAKDVSAIIKEHEQTAGIGVV